MLASRLGGCSTVRSVKVLAQKKDKPGKSVQPGFRWDPALQRWLKDDRFTGKDFSTRVKTKTGQEYTVWPVMHTVLVDEGVQSVTPEKALAMMKNKGYTLLDARVSKEYEASHPIGAKSAPLFRLVPEEKTDFWNLSKKITAVLINQDPTERNPEFLEEAGKAVPRKRKVLVICGLGGTLKTTVSTKKKTFSDPDRGFGKESRSLKACYELIQDGYKEVYHVLGGVSQWRVDGLEFESSQ